MEWLERLEESELFEVIEAALSIAASLYPRELRRRRDAFAEQLFAPRALERPRLDPLNPGNCSMPEIAREGGFREEQKVKNRNLDQDRRRREEEEEEAVVEQVESEQEEDDDDDDDDDDEVVVEERDEIERGRQEQRVQEQELEEEIEGIGEEYDEAEALTDQMEEESRQILEINGIKRRITDMALDDEELLVLLRTLQEMQISVEALKETEIGKEVNGLRKHRSKRICSLAKLLVKGWKDMVNDWVKSAGDVAAAALAAGSSSGSTQYEHGEDGLPSPPMEPGALLAVAHPASAELFEFFDEDWDEELATVPDPSTLPCDRPIAITQPHGREPELQGRREIRASSLDTPVTDMKSQVSESNKPRKRGFEHAAMEDVNATRTAKVSRISLSSSQPQHTVDRISPFKGTGNGVVKKTGSQPLHLANNHNVHQAMLRAQEDMSVAARLEVAKRRLHERYQEEENAKKSRVVQVMDLTELPKGGPNRARVAKAHKPWTQNSRQQHQSRR